LGSRAAETLDVASNRRYDPWFVEAHDMTSSHTLSDGPETASASRRDFLYLVTGSVAAVGLGAAAWPFIAQMNPDAATIAAAGPVDIDISQIQPGQRVVALWSARPVFVVKRGKEALDELRNPKLLANLRDPNSEALQQPTYAANWHRSIKPEILVLVGVCTHLGCIPLFDPTPDPTNPAPYNLPVPPYSFPNDKTVRIGENPPDSSFDFNSILQV
jgi:ubiquinol-cytochrome c reductase iron-sulfur subunit